MKDQLTAPPWDVRPSKVVWMVINTPPPRPLCFDSQQQWQTYLCYLHESGEAITRRQDTGKYAGKRTVTTVFDRIDFCVDCEIGELRQKRMMVEGRCILSATLELETA